MRTLPAVAVTVIASVALAFLPRVVSPYVQSLLASALMYIALATAWAMFSGSTGYISLGTAAFFGLGAYFCAWTIGTLPWGIVIAGGALLAGIFAGVAGMLILHLRGTYFAVLTFGLAELVHYSIAYVERQYSGTVGRVITNAPSDFVVYLTILGTAAAAIVIAIVVRASRFGLALQGIGADEKRSETLGVPTKVIKVTAFALSAAIAGAVGASVAVRWTYIDASAVFDPFIGFQTVLIAMIGGANTITGPIVTAVAFSVLAEFLRLQFPYAYLISLGVLLILAVLFLPNGLAALWKRRPAHMATE